MKKMLNGKLVELTDEEIIAVQEAQAAERTRPLTESEVSRMLIVQQINTLTVDDNTALRMVEFYQWSGRWSFDWNYYRILYFRKFPASSENRRSIRNRFCHYHYKRSFRRYALYHASNFLYCCRYSVLLLFLWIIWYCPFCCRYALHCRHHDCH